MAVTLLQLRNKVKTLLNNDDFFTNVNLDIHINAAYFFHHAIVSDALQNRLALVDSIDIVSGQRDYALSAVKTSGRIVDQIINLKYKAADMSAISFRDLRYETRSNVDDISTTGTPQSYEIMGENISLDPAPNKAITDGLQVTFVPYPETLVNDADEIELSFTGLGADCVAYYAVLAAKAQEETWDVDSSAIVGFKKTYEDMVLRFKNNLEMRAFEEDEIETFGDDDVNY